MPRPPLERFMAHVDQDAPHGCWLWTGARLKRSGYGAFNRGQNVAHYAHRLAYEYFVGPIPTRMQVNHQCAGQYPPGDLTYRRCCNPAHLRAGTQRDNIEDAWRDGRAVPPPVRYGEANNMAVLTEPDIRSIRTAAAGGETFTYLGGVYGVRADTISAIVRRLTWKHVQ
jgi:hypothetical protein